MFKRLISLILPIFFSILYQVNVNANECDEGSWNQILLDNKDYHYETPFLKERNDIGIFFDFEWNSKLKKIIIKNSITGTVEGLLDENITDSLIFVKVHGSLLKLASEEIEDTDINGIDTYSISTDTAEDFEWSNQIQADFTVYSNGVVSASDFERFASISDANKINTSIPKEILFV